MIRNSNDKTNFPHKLLLTDTQVSRICKIFAIGPSANIKFSKTQLSKMVQSRRFLIPDAIGMLSSFSPFKIINSITSSYGKELKDTDPKRLES